MYDISNSCLIKYITNNNKAALDKDECIKKDKLYCLINSVSGAFQGTFF